MLTIEEINKKYPMDRYEMTIEQEREFVKDLFELYESEGFAKVFWSMGGDFEEYHNKPFKVIGRTTEKECDLECLPMWKIQFEDSKIIHAYPDEIIPSKMKANGCTLELK